MSLAVQNSQQLTQATDLLWEWLSRQLAPESQQWLAQKRAKIAQGASDRVFFPAFSAVPRYTGKSQLALTPEDLQAAQAIRPGWSPGHWRVDQAARSLLVLSLPHADVETYLRSLDKLFTTADVGELVALYQTLPLLPHPEHLRAQAAEGVRSNMTSVFNAVALQNPYPADYFDDIAWNQMVLKALFVGSPLYPIWGLDRRATRELALMLRDYAHERWAAQRPVSPELWRPVGPFIDAKLLADLERVFAEPDSAQQAAAALACSQSTFPPAKALLNRYPNWQDVIAQGRLTWETLTQQGLNL